MKHLCETMFPIHISKSFFSILHLKGSQVKLSKCWFISDDCFIQANNADPDEMSHNAAFHLGSSLFAKVPVDGYP